MFPVVPGAHCLGMMPNQRIHRLRLQFEQAGFDRLRQMQLRHSTADGFLHACFGFTGGRGQRNTVFRMTLQKQAQDDGQYRRFSGAGAPGDDGKAPFQRQGNGLLLIIRCIFRIPKIIMRNPDFL